MSIVASGDWWALDSDGLLTVSIVGDMPDYEYGFDISNYQLNNNTSNPEPWASRRNSITSVRFSDSVTSIGKCAFNRCAYLTSVEIPNSVKSIGMWAFYNCSRLKRVRIPNSVTSIGSYAFYYCSRLQSVSIPNSVSGIGYAFWKCSNLTSVTLPYGLTRIGANAFSGCTKLASVVIPNSVTEIASEAFDACNALTDVYYTGTQTQWEAITIASGNAKLSSATKRYGYAPSAPAQIQSPEITVGSVGNPLAAVAGAHNQLNRAFLQMRERLENVPADATNNAGTITGIAMNGVSKGTSGVVDLGTVVTDAPSAVKFTNASAVTRTRNADVFQISFVRKTGDNIEVYAEIPVEVVTDTVGSLESGWALEMATVTVQLSYQSGASWYALSPSPQWQLCDGRHVLRGQWQTNRTSAAFKIQLSVSKGKVSVNAGAASALVYGVATS